MSDRMHESEQRTHGRLIDRTEHIVQMFDAECKDHALHDSREAFMYAVEMADLLEQWAKARRASMNIHPSNRPQYHGPDEHSPIEHVYDPTPKQIAEQRRHRRRQGDWP
jgi:folate-dependent phosphoribosylglycinamide formyltransferase PurN